PRWLPWSQYSAARDSSRGPYAPPPVVDGCFTHADVPCAEKKAPSALSQGPRGAKSACQGTARLPPPRMLCMLLDTIRTPPCGPWAGDHGPRQHSRQPFPFILHTLLCQQKLSNFHISFKPTEHLDSEGMSNIFGHKAVALPWHPSP